MYISPEGNNEIFELLDSFTNFESFKELVLDFRFKMERNFDKIEELDFLITRGLN